jgi:hypothetical protein
MRYGVFQMLLLAAIAMAAVIAPARAQTMIASFSNVSNAKFTVQATGPADIKDKVLDFTACKGVWFARQKNLDVISFGNPAYGGGKSFNMQGLPLKIPDTWIAITAIVYVTEPNPDRNRMVNVEQQAAICRQSWDWFK